MDRAEQNKIEQKRLTKSVRSFVGMNLFQKPISGRHCDPKSSFGRRAWLAFTLAEVLIVLGIIGIVAEMTIPTLVQNTQEKVTVVSLKKVYSTLTQAYTMAAQENGPPSEWGLVANDSPVGAQNIMEKLSPYLRLSKICGDQGGCWADVVTTFLSGNASQNNNLNPAFYKAMLADGTSILTYSYGSCRAAAEPLWQVCGYATVDVNGFKKPNIIGEDIFPFTLTNGGFIPAGAQNGGEYPFDGYCKDKTAFFAGIGCTAWVIYNENMDYKKCSDLSWDGKHKCS